jgi:hypothetical protein
MNKERNEQWLWLREQIRNGLPNDGGDGKTYEAMTST